MTGVVRVDKRGKELSSGVDIEKKKKKKKKKKK